MSIFFDTFESTTPSYEIRYATPGGVYITVIDEYISLTYTLVLGDIGELVLVLPATYDKRTLLPDGKIEVWRRVGLGALRLEGDTVWFIRGIKTIVSEDGMKTYEVRAVSQQEMLKTRIVAYNDATSYTVKSGAADDMMKAIVRENLGSSAVDTLRSIASNLTIAPDTTSGASLTKDFARNVVLDVLKEISDQSMRYGIVNGEQYISFFDIICTDPASNSFMFQTFQTCRGTDRRTTTNQGVLIGPGYHNIGAYTIDESWTDEVTYVYVGGAGEEDVRAIGTASDDARIGRSFLGRREGWIEDRDVADQTTLNQEGQAYLIANRPRRVLEAKWINRPQVVYGRDVLYGDYITIDVEDLTLDMRINGVTVTVQSNGEETVEFTLRGNN